MLLQLLKAAALSAAAQACSLCIWGRCSAVGRCWPLQGLSGLQTLKCEWGDATTGVVQAVSQLTRLRTLIGFGSVRMDEGSLLQLTQLKQLTSLRYPGPRGRAGHILMSGELHAVACFPKGSASSFC